MKRCPRCKQALPRDAFNKNRATKDGLQTQCRGCSVLTRKEYEERNAEVIQLRRAEKLARTPDSSATKACRRCGDHKPMLSFYAHRSTGDGRASYCIDCVKAERRAWVAANADQVKKQNAEWSAANPDRKKRDHRQYWLKMYGLTQESYQALLERQGGVCAICRQPERYIDSRTGEPRRLNVDHCHSTNRVRGLLCGHCNRGIGQFSDDVDRLRRAAEYLSTAAS